MVPQPQRRVLYPIPPNFIDIAIKSMPFMIGLIASVMRFSDYLWSGTLLRAANFLPCCDNFDFIVVGAGSTGSVIASRLSEQFRVLLIEAGGDPNPYSYFPITVAHSLRHPELDWDYKTVPQNGCAHGLVNQEVVWPRGKSLGGCSNLNFMIYMKGNPRDYDRWAAFTEDDKWKYENVDKYFRKIEDYYGYWEENGSHGKGGPLRIERVKYAPGLDYVLDAAKEIGFEVRDLNHDQQSGFSPLDLTQKRGLRYNVYRAYIKPNKFRNNLVIYRYTTATKIHFDKNLRAVGVSYIRHGVKGYATAKKEIILSAGAVNSPQLLMLSGIGPSPHLVDHKIPPIVDLPGVGGNLVDHVTTIAGPFLLNDSASFMLQRDMDVGAFFNLAAHGNGPLTSPLGIMGVGLASTSFAASPKWPDIMYTIAGQGVFNGLAELIDEKFNMGNKAKNYLTEYVGRGAHFVLITLGLPKSRGFIRLKNSNPLSKPLINPNYYSDPENQDVKAMVEGIEIIMKLYENTASLQRIGSHLAPKHFPGCEHLPLKSRAYYDCVVRTVTVTLFHPTGTCKMGRRNDPDAVVDSDLRVIGVTGLRVADASVMPFITNANTNAPCIVIGEICSDIIKRTWGR